MDNFSIVESYAIIRLFGNYHLQHAIRPEHLTKDLDNIAECVDAEYFTILDRIDNITETHGQRIRENFALFQQEKVKLDRIFYD